MLKFVPNIWPPCMFVVHTLIAVVLQTSRRQRKMSHLQPAQPRALQGWLKNLGPPSGPTHIFPCIAFGPVFHLLMWGKARKASPSERGASVAAQRADGLQHTRTIAHRSCSGTLHPVRGHKGLSPAARKASGCAVRMLLKSGCQ